MNNGGWRGQIKWRLDGALRVGLRVWRALCIGVCLCVLGYFAFRVGRGIAQAWTGCVSPAQMLEALEMWLRGFEP